MPSRRRPSQRRSADARRAFRPAWLRAASVLTAVLSLAPPAATAWAAEPGHAAPLDYWSMLFVFVLASLIGLGVIRRVSRLLHTPLMSLTNAISAIAVVGSIIVAGSDYPQPIRFLGFVALAASTTNIVSGFLITDRMLKMFRVDRTRPEKPSAGGPGDRP